MSTITYRFWLTVALCTLLAIVAIGVYAGVADYKARNPSTVPTQPVLARYTADQVIAVVQAQYWSVRLGQYAWVRGPAKIAVSYHGQGVWEVKVRAPAGFFLNDYSMSKTLHFYETTGSLE